MERSVDKSCWGITLWAIAIVIAVALLGSFVMGSTASTSAPSKTVITG